MTIRSLAYGEQRAVMSQDAQERALKSPLPGWATVDFYIPHEGLLKGMLRAR